MLSLLIQLLLGGIIGWIASIIMKTNAQMGIVYNILAGIVGSFLGFWIVNGVLDLGVNENIISISGFLSSVVGAVILIYLVKLIRKIIIRQN